MILLRFIKIAEFGDIRFEFSRKLLHICEELGQQAQFSVLLEVAKESRGAEKSRGAADDGGQQSAPGGRCRRAARPPRGPDPPRLLHRSPTNILANLATLSTLLKSANFPPSTLLISTKPGQKISRFRLYRQRILQRSIRCPAFFEIYNIIYLVAEPVGEADPHGPEQRAVPGGGHRARGARGLGLAVRFVELALLF